MRRLEKIKEDLRRKEMTKEYGYYERPLNYIKVGDVIKTSENAEPRKVIHVDNVLINWNKNTDKVSLKLLTFDNLPSHIEGSKDFKVLKKIYFSRE